MNGADRRVRRFNSAKDEETIREVEARLRDAWNKQDAKEYASFFAEDAELVNIFGSVFHGREAIQERLTEVFSTVFRNSVQKTFIRKIRFIRPDVALVDVDHEIAYDGVLSPLHTKMKCLMTKENGKWVIVAAQNTDVKSPPTGR